MNKELLYLDGNQHLRPGIVSTTARKGEKWHILAKPGDVLDCRITQTRELFAQVAVTKVELTSYSEVLRTALDNHGTTATDIAEARGQLASALTAAYGPLAFGEVFTKIHFIPLNVDINRADVYSAVDSERDYQERKWEADVLTVGDQILLAAEYVDLARKEWAHERTTVSSPSLHMMRKVAAIAVHCMEDHGAPTRAQEEAMKGRSVQ